MDIVKLDIPGDTLEIFGGEIINNIDTKLWIERYKTPGEFKFTTKHPAELQEKLPIGSYITHIDSTDIMCVEDHHIVEEVDKQPVMTITGRSLMRIFESRYHGAVNHASTGPGKLPKIVNNNSNVVSDIYNLMIPITAHSPDNSFKIGSLGVNDNLGADPGPTANRAFPRKSLFDLISDLLNEDNIGMRIIRPGPWSTSYYSVALIIHRGEIVGLPDNEPMFSYQTGSVKKAEYFWSNKKELTSVYVHGIWLHTLVEDGTYSGINKKVGGVYVPELDEQYTTRPTGADETQILEEMETIGRSLLEKSKQKTLLSAEIAQGAKDRQYRVDYNIGDIIVVEGNYNVSSIMRVIEHVEAEDENGYSSYPMLEPYE